MPVQRSLRNQQDPHTLYMTMALECADAVKGTTFPNPAVGAVLVKNNVVIGKGATSYYGGPHAEINAMAEAGSKAKGSTLYVTLEPCSHFGKTPPCADAVVKAGIKTVYVACSDPNPLVKGKGIRILRKNGIEVFAGLCKDEATALNEDFFYWITNKKPWISVKLAMTLDGCIADTCGNSKWITSSASRSFVHDIRRRHAGIAVGRTTLVKDDPKLDVRYGKTGNPIRFVFSSKKTLPPTSYFVKTAVPKHGSKNSNSQRSILVVRGGTQSKQILANGVELWQTGKHNSAENLHEFLSMAHEENISSILVEGGAKLVSGFLENKLVNKVYLFYGNRILGGGARGIDFEKPLAIQEYISLDNMEMQRFDNDMLLSGKPLWR